MSDERLRELERRWKETGSTEDEAAYLRERLRVGDLPLDRVELAAEAAYPAALLVVGRPAESQLAPEQVTQLLERVVEQTSDECLLRLWAADCAERWLTHFEARHPDDDAAREAIRRARDFAQGRLSAGAMREAGLRVFAVAQRDAREMATDDAAARAASAAMGAWAATVTEPFGVRAVVSEEPWADFAPAERHWQLRRLVARLLHGSIDLPTSQ